MNGCARLVLPGWTSPRGGGTRSAQAARRDARAEAARLPPGARAEPGPHLQRRTPASLPRGCLASPLARPPRSRLSCVCRRGAVSLRHGRVDPSQQHKRNERSEPWVRAQVPEDHLPEKEATIDLDLPALARGSREEPLDLVIVGGGPAGFGAADIASARGLKGNAHKSSVEGG